LELAVTKGAVSIRLLGISESLRRRSYCTAILRTFGQTIAESTAPEIFDLSSIHPYNEDEEGERLPRAVLALADKISLRRLARPAIA
jgi:NAD(P)H-dependent FMN reductase